MQLLTVTASNFKSALRCAAEPVTLERTSSLLQQYHLCVNYLNRVWPTITVKANHLELSEVLPITDYETGFNVRFLSIFFSLSREFV